MHLKEVAVVIKKSQAVTNLERAFVAAMVNIIPRIDEKLKDHMAGDIASVTLLELDIDPALSSALYHKILGEIVNKYKAAGWEVDLIQGNGIEPHFTFK